MPGDARLLELRFGGKTLSPEQAVALPKKEDAEKAQDEAENGVGEQADQAKIQNPAK